MDFFDLRHPTLRCSRPVWQLLLLSFSHLWGLTRPMARSSRSKRPSRLSSEMGHRQEEPQDLQEPSVTPPDQCYCYYFCYCYSHCCCGGCYYKKQPFVVLVSSRSMQSQRFLCAFEGFLWFLVGPCLEQTILAIFWRFGAPKTS